MAECEDVTEKLKADNQMEWVARMNNIRCRATEIVNHDIMYNWPKHGGREINTSLPSSFLPKTILLRFYTGLLTDFTTKTYNIGVLKRKVQKINVKGDIENEKDY